MGSEELFGRFVLDRVGDGFRLKNADIDCLVLISLAHLPAKLLTGLQDLQW